MPSIGSNISDAVAFVLGNNATERIKIASDIKTLYGIRSAIVHSGRSSVSYINRSLIINYTRSCIQTLLTHNIYSSIATVKEFNIEIAKLRFS